MGLTDDPVERMAQELERAYQQLEIHGVPRARARSVANGIEVLTTRFRKAEQSYEAMLRALRDERDRLQEAIQWALGYTDFRSRESGEGAYWWRNELQQRAGIAALPTKGK